MGRDVHSQDHDGDLEFDDDRVATEHGYVYCLASLMGTIFRPHQTASSQGCQPSPPWAGPRMFHPSSMITSQRSGARLK